MNRKEFFISIAKGLALLGAFEVGLLKLDFNKQVLAQTPGGIKLDYKTKPIILKHTWTISRSSIDEKKNIFVKLEKDGVFGLGEASPNLRYNETVESTIKIIEKSRNIFKDSSPDQFNELGYKIAVLDTEQNSAKAAVDIALMDLVTKKLGVPLYKYLGLDKSKTPITSFSIGIDKPEIIKKKVKEASIYPLLKIKVGKENDKEIIEAIRSVTDKPIRVDANEGWKTKEEALEKILWLEKMGVEFVEQPMPVDKIEDVMWLRERVHIPIIADESVKTASDIPKLAKAYDGINIKLMKSGGIQEALRMIAIAKSLNMKIMLGCMIESSLGITAAAHLSPMVDYADLDGNLLISNDPFKGVIVEKGKLILPDKPGLGVTGDW